MKRLKKVSLAPVVAHFARNARFIDFDTWKQSTRLWVFGATLVGTTLIAACGGGGDPGSSPTLVGSAPVVSAPAPVAPAPAPVVVAPTPVAPAPSPVVVAPPAPAPSPAPAPAPSPVVEQYSVIMGISTYKIGMPVRISGTTCANTKVEEAVNATSFPERSDWNFALFNSMLHQKLTASGKIWVASQVVADSNRTRSFIYSAVTNQLRDDDGSEGVAPKYTPFAERDPGWVFASKDDHPSPVTSVGVMAAWAQNDRLLVYGISGDITGKLYCEDLVAGVRSGKPIQLSTTDEYGNFTGLWVFQN